MKNRLKIIYDASKEVLQSKKYVKIFAFLTLFMVAVYIIIPVLTIEGNDLLFQLSVFTIKDWLLIVPLSGLIGLMITMQVYSYKKQKSLNVAKGVAVSSSGIIAGLFGTAGCSSCLASLFGFLGVGNVFFLLEHQVYVVSISFILILVSIYFTSKKMTCGSICEK